jgi:hypothetical protein
MRPGVRGGHPEDGLNRGCAQSCVVRAAAGQVGAALTPEPVIVDLQEIVDAWCEFRPRHTRLRPGIRARITVRISEYSARGLSRSVL